MTKNTQSLVLVHANAAGIMGGNALCGNNQEGGCTDHEPSITCHKCLQIIEEHKSKSRYTPQRHD